MTYSVAKIFRYYVRRSAGREQPIQDGYVEETYYLVKQLHRHRDVERCCEKSGHGQNDRGCCPGGQAAVGSGPRRCLERNEAEPRCMIGPDAAQATGNILEGARALRESASDATCPLPIQLLSRMMNRKRGCSGRVS